MTVSAEPTTNPTTNPTAKEVELRAYLAARMLPLSLLLAILVGCAAPLADYVLTLHSLRAQAQTRAEQLAAVIEREASERPVLWHYDTPKLLMHVHANLSQQVEVRIVDRNGRALELGRSSSQLPDRLLWASAPIKIDGKPAGFLWVGLQADQALREALLLLLPFGLLGLGLALLVYFLPLRAMSRAESQIRGLIARLHQSQRALESFNQTLEQQVEQRSSELQAANNELRQKEEHIRTLSSRASALQEAERRGIARDLHDSAGQALTAIRINLQLIEQMAGQQAFVEATASKTMAMTDATVEEIRRAVASLSPAILDDFGLAVAVRRLCDDFGERTGLEVAHSVELREERCSPAIETAVYRMAQEALTNIKRHAAAETVEVRLWPEQGRLKLEVRDDGKGVSPDEVARATSRPPEQGGRGLHGMRERCELLGGTLRIDSEPGCGTSVHIELPMV